MRKVGNGDTPEFWEPIAEEWEIAWELARAAAARNGHQPTIPVHASREDELKRGGAVTGAQRCPRCERELYVSKRGQRLVTEGTASTERCLKNR